MVEGKEEKGLRKKGKSKWKKQILLEEDSIEENGRGALALRVNISS